jgi:hypothetical protein
LRALNARTLHASYRRRSKRLRFQPNGGIAFRECLPERLDACLAPPAMIAATL